MFKEINFRMMPIKVSVTTPPPPTLMTRMSQMSKSLEQKRKRIKIYPLLSIMMIAVIRTTFQIVLMIRSSQEVLTMSRKTPLSLSIPEGQTRRTNRRKNSSTKELLVIFLLILRLIQRIPMMQGTLEKMKMLDCLRRIQIIRKRYLDVRVMKNKL